MTTNNQTSIASLAKRRITTTPLEIRPKLKNSHGVQRALTFDFTLQQLLQW